MELVHESLLNVCKWTNPNINTETTDKKLYLVVDFNPNNPDFKETNPETLGGFR